MTVIETLIDKQDNFELVRDKIAYILVTESASQMAKAVTAGKDSSLWKLRVYTERTNPLDVFNVTDPDTSPIVNVAYESGDFNASASNIVELQQHEAIYNIDCFGYGISEDSIGGHNCGDEMAVKAAQRACRLVRNILMSANYTYLDLRGYVGQRWPLAIRMMEIPPSDRDNALNISVARLQLRVRMVETSPQYAGDTLELVTNTFKRAEDGQIILTVHYDYEEES